MYRVLVPIDTSEDRAASQARAVAALPDATGSVEAVLLHVFDDEDRADETTPTQLPAGKRAREILEARDIAVRQESVVGDPADAILTAAGDLHADAIVMGGRKRSRVGALLFGSVSQAVTLGADLPVTITGDDVAGDPTFVCATCGERYYTEAEITKCNSCGGVKVEEAV